MISAVLWLDMLSLKTNVNVPSTYCVEGLYEANPMSGIFRNIEPSLGVEGVGGQKFGRRQTLLCTLHIYVSTLWPTARNKQKFLKKTLFVGILKATAKKEKAT